MGILRDLVEQKAFDIVKKRIEREESQALTNTEDIMIRLSIESLINSMREMVIAHVVE